MTHHGKEEEHQGSQSGPVLHGGEGDPLGGGLEDAAPMEKDPADDETGTEQPPPPNDEPKPGL